MRWAHAGHVSRIQPERVAAGFLLAAIMAAAGLGLAAAHGAGTAVVTWALFAASCLAIAALLTVFAGFRDRGARLHQLTHELERVARIDSLTTVFNRRHLDEQLAAILSAGRRHDSPVSLLLLDVDNLKHINEAGGHAAGDAVLQEVAARLRNAARIEDVVGRWGGDEFMVILPATAAGGAAVAAQRLLVAICDVPMSIRGVLLDLSVSIGVATGVEESPDQLSRLADAGLQDARAQGNGRAVSARGELVAVL